ncbi:MAG: TonB-dependent receptor [Rhodanobacter sp.]
MNTTNKPLQRTVLASTMVAVFSLSLGTASAQDQSANISTGSTTRHAGANKANKMEAATLSTVIVTAEKRSQDARKVPSSISVVSAEQLQNQHVSSLVDLAGSIPGVQIDSGGTPGQTSIIIRGISSFGEGAVVGTYVDDSPLGASGNAAEEGSYQLDLLPYDLERVEVLRGPQGTLYGAGAMGGLVKYVLKEPDLDVVSGKVGGGISSVSGASAVGWDGRARLNLPLIQDKLGIAVSVAQNQTPGYIDNVVTGKNDINAVTQKSGLFSLLWKPSDDVKLKVSALHQSVNADDNGVITLDLNTQQPIYGEQKTGALLAQPFRKQVNFYSATLNWDLHWADFTSATSYSTSNLGATLDYSPTFGAAFPLLGNFPAGLASYESSHDLKKVTQEFRLASKPDDHIEWLLGAFYTRENGANHQVGRSYTFDGAPLAGLDPILNGVIANTYKEGALFGNLTYKFTDKFDITAGLRYARNEQNYQQDVTDGFIVPLGVTYGHSAEDVLTWMLTPKYQLNDDSMLYIRAASGYRPGGPNIALPGVPPTVKSDTLINYEAGWKSLFFERKVSVDFSIYAINWRGIQLSTQTSDGLGYIANAASATSRGAELSTAFRPTRNLQLSFNAGYTNAYLTEDAPALLGKKGDSLPGIPRFTSSVNSDYYFDLPNAWGAHVGGGYRWIGGRWSGVNSSPYTYRENGYGVLDLNADISKDIWQVRFYIKNLTNTHPHLNIIYRQNPFTGDVAVLQSTVMQPRTVGLEFNVQF